jgi:transcriptional regulator
MGLDLSVLQSTLDYVILKTLSWGPMHGFGIARWLEDATRDALSIEEGTLYPALHRLERRKLITGEWRLTENNRRARYYRITAAGERALQSHATQWSGVVKAVAQVVRAAEQRT